jgi:hypothetical protein
MVAEQDAVDAVAAAVAKGEQEGADHRRSDTVQL